MWSCRHLLTHRVQCQRERRLRRARSRTIDADQWPGYARPVSTHTVLLTGGSGFLGKRVRASLDADPAVAVSVLRKRLSELDDTFYVDVVIHLAAWTPKSSRASNLDEIIDANVVGLQRLLNRLDPPPRRLLFASTIDVYGTQAEQQPSEHSPLDPMSTYAASKLLGERIVIEDAGARGFEVSVMRLGHIYGPGEEAYEKFVPASIRALMKGRPPTVVGNGQTRRDLLYVDDAAEIIRRLALAPHSLPEIINVGGSNTYTIEEVARALIEVVGFMGRVRYLSDHPLPASAGFDTTLLSNTIGEVNEVSLIEGLRREVAHVVALECSST